MRIGNLIFDKYRSLLKHDSPKERFKRKFEFYKGKLDALVHCNLTERK